ncbi:hypothetical protein [Euzebya pacifica]|uniref:hypothetical protein n=1 Tax=Euzebya pacifica TaxID=1608957 RepID=UPI001C1FC5F6|nr:hypothetical protein [Euzebya pacifica]
MSRIRLLPPEEWTPELRELVQPEGRTDLELGNVRIYAHRPELAEAYVRFTGAIRSRSTLPARLIEIVRLRVAFQPVPQLHGDPLRRRGRGRRDRGPGVLAGDARRGPRPD